MNAHRSTINEFDFFLSWQSGTTTATTATTTTATTDTTTKAGVVMKVPITGRQRVWQAPRGAPYENPNWRFESSSSSEEVREWLILIAFTGLGVPPVPGDRPLLYY